MNDAKPPITMPIQLPIGRYRCTFIAQEAVRLPAYSGSAWRGAFGHSLKKMVCITRLSDCNACLLQANCVYQQIFETPLPPNAQELVRYKNAPHPFALEPEKGREQLEKGQSFTLTLTLFGAANEQLPYYIQALHYVGESGLGQRRSRLQLHSVAQCGKENGNEWPLIYQAGEKIQALPPFIPTPPAPNAEVKMQIHTPLRIKKEGRYAQAKELRFHDVARALIRRIALLTLCYTNTPLQPNFKALAEQAKTIAFTKSNLYYQPLQRYSSRQQKNLKMDGLMGTVYFHSAEIACFWDYLWLGQWTYLGNLSSMGLGHYSLAGD